MLIVTCWGCVCVRAHMRVCVITTTTDKDPVLQRSERQALGNAVIHFSPR